MTPTYLNSPPSPFPAAEYHNDLHDHPLFFSSIHQAAGHAASSSSYDLSTNNFFNSSSTTTQDDQSVFYHKELQQPHVQQDHADNFDSHGGLYDIENYTSINVNGLKFSTWKKEDNYENHQQGYHESTSTYNKVKWMSSKIRLMHKMKNNIDTTAVSPPPSVTTLIKPEDQIKEQIPLSPMEAAYSSNTASSNNSTNPIRVCSDCNTTKTPLWRGGPQGPKSLCNACGIRQRKARRAMAASANERSLESGTTVIGLKTKTKTKPKTEQKEKRSSSTSTGHNVAKYKNRRSKLITSTEPTSSSHFENFLISLTNNLANFHQVFPQDEKEAAILLMALSCDHAHG